MRIFALRLKGKTRGVDVDLRGRGGVGGTCGVGVATGVRTTHLQKPTSVGGDPGDGRWQGTWAGGRVLVGEVVSQ